MVMRGGGTKWGGEGQPRIWGIGPWQTLGFDGSSNLVITWNGVYSLFPLSLLLGLLASYEHKTRMGDMGRLGVHGPKPSSGPHIRLADELGTDGAS